GGSLRDRYWANAASLRDLAGAARLRLRGTGQVTRSRALPKPLRDGASGISAARPFLQPVA
ncbi:hypothetical protein, partial [Actinomadura luteofluorescens]